MNTKHLEHPSLQQAAREGAVSGLIGQDRIAASTTRWQPLSPIDLAPLPGVSELTAAAYEDMNRRLAMAFRAFRQVPAPRRGQLIKRFAMLVEQHKDALARLVTLEVGKIRAEALGEVQEVIDVCDFAVGLSRQLHGLTMVSERFEHRMMEQWHPLGTVAIITAFNFPLAVWAWNACLALVCGNVVLWKPAEQTPNCARALHELLQEALADFPDLPADIAAVAFGAQTLGQRLADDRRIALVSATGSCAMGRDVASRVGARLGKSLLELGGNNALICTPSADLDLALRAIVFSAVGTAGQRCTSLRRLLVHESIEELLLTRLENALASIHIGDPREADVLMGPLIGAQAFERMQQRLQQAVAQGARLRYGGTRLAAAEAGLQGLQGYYVRPALVSCTSQIAAMHEETFAPILYVLPYRSFDEAIEYHNAVAQGLSSAIFTNDLREAERFLAAGGSDCGIANVNIGTSGAEIGGAFGGEKDSGGGRESGSDAWKSYMRRTTNTINYGHTLPLAQGVHFEV
ncbi:MAG: aldehyde dehydrogenase family protein [Sterolibacterium sp.]|nr:aldehyde dehydrogenase family protein [Sterolibacterium sp.]MBP9800167.1 aldehyde dehydrogenase family protein [Sterolibacterium sp.]